MNLTLAPSPRSVTLGEGTVDIGRLDISATDPALDGAVSYARSVLQPTNPGLSPSAGRIPVRLTLGKSEELGALEAPIGVSPFDGPAGLEGYVLDVRIDGVMIAADHPVGVIRGIATLAQMITHSIDGKLAVAHVVDMPRLAWRGLSLDVVRKVFTVSELREIIDLLAALKLNVLHLHLSDAQGWRLEIISRPELTQVGAAHAAGDRPGGYFTQAEYRDLVQYATDRGIVIVPEIDLPGHAGAILRSYPQLAAAQPPSDEPGSHERPYFLLWDTPGVAELVRDVFTEIVQLTPTPYIHFGGDEAWGMPHGEYVRFVDELRVIVDELGKKSIGWQESTRGNVAPGELTQYWITQTEVDRAQLRAMGAPDVFIDMLERSLLEAQADVPRAVAAGAQVLVSAQEHLYLDVKYADLPRDAEQEADRQRLGLPTYPASHIQSVYEFDPAGIPTIPVDQLAGVEAAVWCESVETFSDLQFLLLPRLFCIAERGWANTDADWEAFQPTLEAVANEYVLRGWNVFRPDYVAL